ncbi:MAG: sigma-70 family RNA polymerase sigma factor [Lachnospiraceae bacterium]|nr:sigma-70 family RNA polymerase sigma factor [Lachnospiraceae bacterium]
MTDFDNIYENHHIFIFKYLMKLCKSPSLAEELTQETFFRAYMNYNKLRDKNKVCVWLCQIAKNSYYAWYNETKKLTTLENTQLPEMDDIANSFVCKSLSSEAFRKLHTLEEPYKEVFMLSVFANLSLKEISSIFGKSESWARVTFYRAKKKLLEKMR